jgi:membrane protease subunit HflK
MPDFDAIIARLQAMVRGWMPRGGASGGRGLALIAIALVALWLASGFYRVQPDEQGLVLRFGAYDRSTLPGLNYHIPWPVESVDLLAVTRINRTEIGFRSAGGDGSVATGRGSALRDVPEESLMLTGDENIVDIDVAVFWRINSGVDYLFNVRDPEGVVKAVAESVMREVIGRTPIQPAMTELRAKIETDVRNETQQILNQYQAGVEVTQVQLQKVDPPEAVIESFRDVQRANTDAERLRNEADAYRNDIVPRARGDAARITAEAEGAKAASVANATGQTQRFLSVLAAYQQAKQVTLERMYIETMQDIMTHSTSVILDDKVRGLLPFLPLNDLPKPAAPAASGASTGPSALLGSTMPAGDSK